MVVVVAGYLLSKVAMSRWHVGCGMGTVRIDGFVHCLWPTDSRLIIHALKHGRAKVALGLGIKHSYVAFKKASVTFLLR